MTDKPIPKVPKQQPKIIHPGMMGDGTEEQNLNEPGDPSARIRGRGGLRKNGREKALRHLDEMIPGQLLEGDQRGLKAGSPKHREQCSN